MGFEPTTTCLGSKDSTTELRPPFAIEKWNPTLASVLSQGNRYNCLTFILRHGELSSADAQTYELAGR